MNISKDEISLWEYPLGLREHLLKIEGDEIEINDILHTIERVDWLFWLLIKLGVSKFLNYGRKFFFYFAGLFFCHFISPCFSVGIQAISRRYRQSCF